MMAERLASGRLFLPREVPPPPGPALPPERVLSSAVEARVDTYEFLVVCTTYIYISKNGHIFLKTTILKRSKYEENDAQCVHPLSIK